MEVAFPDRLHGHQHGALDNTVCQGRDTQRSQLAFGFRDIDPLDRLGPIAAMKQVFTQLLQVITQVLLHALLVYSVNAGRSGAT